jgi:hypothetical protein
MRFSIITATTHIRTRSTTQICIPEPECSCCGPWVNYAEASSHYHATHSFPNARISSSSSSPPPSCVSMQALGRIHFHARSAHSCFMQSRPILMLGVQVWYLLRQTWQKPFGVYVPYRAHDYEPYYTVVPSGCMDEHQLSSGIHRGGSRRSRCFEIIIPRSCFACSRNSCLSRRYEHNKTYM